MEIDQLNIFDQLNSISGCEDLIDGLPKKKIEGMNCFSIGRTETYAYIQSFEYVPSTGNIPKFSLVIENDFTYEAYHHGVKCNIATLSANRIYTVNKWSRIQESVRFLTRFFPSVPKREHHLYL